MKVKILKLLITQSEYPYNNGDDYETVTNYLVRGDTDFEEVTDNEHKLLVNFVQKYNLENAPYKLILVYEPYRITRELISELIDKEKKALEAKEEEKRKKEVARLRQLNQDEKEKARKKEERLKKQLAKIQEQLGENKKS